MRNAVAVGVLFFNHPRKELADLKNELEILKKKGIDFIQIEEVWHYSEPRYENYDFLMISQVIKAAESLDIKIEVAVNMDCAPAWLIKETELSTIDYSMYPPDHSKMICWEHPLIQKTSERYLKALAQQVGKSGAVTNWVICGPQPTWQQRDLFDGASYCQCKHTQIAFQDWLKNKYKTLSAFNSAINQNFSDWGHIFPTNGSSPLSNEWVRFFTWRRSEVQKIFCNFIKKFDKKSRPVAYMNSYFQNESTPIIALANAQSAIAQAGEQAGGVGAQSMSAKDAGAKDASAKVSGAKVSGAKVSSAKVLGAKVTGAAKGGYQVDWTGVLPAGRQAAGLWRALPPTQRSLANATFASLALGATKLLFSQIPDDKQINFIKNCNKFISPAELDAPEVAIIVNSDSHILASQSGEHNLVPDSVANLVSILTARGVFPAIIADECNTDLSQYKVVFLASPFVINQKLVSTITEYVKNGGVLVSDGMPGTFDQVSNPVTSPALIDLFGCEELSTVPCPKHATLMGVGEFSMNNISAKKFIQTFTPTSGSPAYKYDEAVAGVANAHSLGSTLLIGTIFSSDTISSEFIGTILDSSSVKSLDLKVTVQSLISEDYWVVFAFNKHDIESKFVLDETEGYNLVDSYGCQINIETFKVTIEGNSSGCIIFQRSKKE